MRIGIDCRTYGSTGGHIGKYIQNLVSYLDQKEDTNEYVLFFNDREFGEFSSKSTHIRAIKTIAKIGDLSEQFIFPYELHKEKLNIMLFSEPRIPFLYFGKGIVILSDLVSYFYPEKQRKGSFMRYWSNLILRHSIKKASSIIAWSEVLKRDIIEIFDTHEEKIQVIPPMCDEVRIVGEHEIQQFFTTEGITKEYILSVGELREYKNIPRLLTAYNLLLKEDGIDMDLILVGKEETAYHDIRSTLIGLGLQSRVHIYNVLDDEKIGFLYQRASLYVLPSLYEGSEQAILYPLAYNLTIASALLPSITVLLEKDDAVFFRPMSVPDMREAMKKALSDSKKKTKKDMSAFSASLVIDKVMNLFNDYRKDERTKF